LAIDKELAKLRVLRAQRALRAHVLACLTCLWKLRAYVPCE